MKTKRQTILPYRIEVTASNDGLTSHAGLPLVAETMRASGLDRATYERLHLQQRNGGLTDYQKVEAIVVLMAAGGDCYDDMAVLRSDEGLQRLKAGTIEHIHDVTKNELGAAPPSKYFGANAAWYRFSMLTYNVLSAMKSIALPPTLSAARPKRLRFTLFNLAGKMRLACRRSDPSHQCRR